MEKENGTTVWCLCCLSSRITGKKPTKKGAVTPFLSIYSTLNYQPSRLLRFLALFAKMVGSRTSPQQVHFQASKDRTKS
jgi:hypothetical protein